MEQRVLGGHAAGEGKAVGAAIQGCQARFERRADLWDTATGRHLGALAHPGGLVLGVAFSRDGLLATGCEDKVVRVWDATGRELLALRGHDGVCGCVA